MNIPGAWDIELETKPDLHRSLERIYAWFEQEMIDRPPIRFVSNNQVKRDSLSDPEVGPGKRWETYRDRWYDAEYRIHEYEKSIEGVEFLGEDMPIFWADFSPHFLAGCYGAEIDFDHTTGWITKPILADYDDLENRLQIREDCRLFKAGVDLVSYGASRCRGKYFVSYPDINVLGDTLEALRGTQNYLMDLYDEPEGVKKAHEIISRDFFRVYDMFDRIVKAGGSMNCSWMQIPVFGRFYNPTADIATMFSSDMYEEYYFDAMDEVINAMDHTVYHTDGPGVAKHVDILLQHKKLNGFQLVQGMGKDRPILQWVPWIRKVQAAGKSVICDVDLCDLEAFIDAIPDPRGIFLFIESHDTEEKRAILKRIEKW